MAHHAALNNTLTILLPLQNNDAYLSINIFRQSETTTGTVVVRMRTMSQPWQVSPHQLSKHLVGTHCVVISSRYKKDEH